MSKIEKITLIVFAIIFCVVVAIFVYQVVDLMQWEPDPNYVPPEKEHLYWKTIEVEVIDADCRHWYASGHHYTADIKVYSAEYDLTQSFHLEFNDAKELQNTKNGDILEATLYTWKLDSTDTVIKREIHSIR